MATRGPYRKGEVVREEILQAAESLLAERMPGEVSVRDVAERAGVQHSVVHRHFETKDRLLAEVVKRTITSYAESIAGCDDPAGGFVAGMTYMADHRAPFAALARTVANASVHDDIDRFPGLELQLRRLDPDAVEDRSPLEPPATDGSIDPRVLGAALMALTSGWAFMEDWWLASAGLQPSDREAARAQVAVIIEQLVEHYAPPR